jgi:phage baseplate assembly protein V
VIRGIIQHVIEGVIKRFTAAGRAGETIADREYFQHYGFTSRPLAGAEGIIICEGNHVVMIASDDRRYRIALEDGEVCLYSDEGDHIRLKRGKEIYIKSGGKLTAVIENEVSITTKAAKITASNSCEVTSPAVTVNASAIQMGGSEGTMRAIIDERLIAWLTNHTHNGSPAPDQSLAVGDVATTITKAG